MLGSAIKQACMYWLCNCQLHTASNKLNVASHTLKYWTPTYYTHIYIYIYISADLSERRACESTSPASQPFRHPASPLNSLSSSANQPARPPNLVAASLRAHRLAYYLLKGTELRCETAPQPATARHRPPQVATGCPTLWPLHPLKPR